MRRGIVLAAGFLLLGAACASPPRPTQGARRLSANEPAVVEGRVTDRAGRPVAGIRVEGLPRGKDIEWSQPATTDSQGRFRLSLFAPASYGFVLSWKGITVVTAEADDPARLEIVVQPGEHQEGVELHFLRESWEKILNESSEVMSPPPYNGGMASERKTTPRRVRCVINGEERDVWEGYRLWDAALDADARLWHWCGGHGHCTTCAVLPLSGAENLTPPTKLETFSLKLWFAKPLAFIRKRWKGKPLRLACQAYVRGPVEVVGLFGKKAKEARSRRGL